MALAVIKPAKTAKTSSVKVVKMGPVQAAPVRESFTPAVLRPGELLLIEFSRPGGSKQHIRAIEAIDDPLTKRQAKEIHKQIETGTQKLVNIAYAKMLKEVAHTPWGFFCTEGDLPKVSSALKEVQETAWVMNRFAVEMKHPRRVRIEYYPLKWDHTDVLFRRRIGELIAQKLLDLRNTYTASIMWKYRVRLARAQNLDRLLMPGDQASMVRDAIHSARSQRKVMVAIYGERYTDEYVDASGRIKDGVKLDFTAIDRAIQYFCPAWDPEKTELPY